MYRDNDEAAKLRAEALERERDGLLERIKKLEARLDSQEEKLNALARQLSAPQVSSPSKPTTPTKPNHHIVEVVFDINDPSKGYLTVELKELTDGDEERLYYSFKTQSDSYNSSNDSELKNRYMKKMIEEARKLCFFCITNYETSHLNLVASMPPYQKEIKEVFFRKHSGLASPNLDWLEKHSLLIPISKQAVRICHTEPSLTKEEQWGL